MATLAPPGQEGRICAPKKISRNFHSGADGVVGQTPPPRPSATPPGQEGKIARKFSQFVSIIFTAWPLAAIAQDEGPKLIQIPNPMAAHTWFIIAAVGAFLAWCISYVLQFRRNQSSEKSDKAKRIAWLHEKDELLDRIAQLESEKDAGTIPMPRYEKEYRKARSRLSDVLGRLGGKRDSAED